MIHRSSLLLASLLLAAGCGGNVVVDGASTTTGAGGATTTATTGAGAATGTTTITDTTFTGTTTTGTFTNPTCPGSLMEVIVDNGAPQTFKSFCAMTGYNPTASAEPIAYVFAGGPPPGINALTIAACAGAGMVSEGVRMAINDVSSPGTYSNGVFQYWDPSGSVWSFQPFPFKVNIGNFGPVGSFVDGGFSATVTHVMNGNAAHTLQGKFHICHVPDELVP